MAYTPDARVTDILNKGEQGEENKNPEGNPKGEKCRGATGDGCSGPPYHMGSHGRRVQPGSTCICSGMREYDPETPGPPANILDQLVAALCDAGLEGNPQHSQKWRWDAGYLGRRPPGTNDSNLDDDGVETPQVKIPPPIFKGIPGNDLTHIFWQLKTGWKLCNSR